MMVVVDDYLVNNAFFIFWWKPWSHFMLWYILEVYFVDENNNHASYDMRMIISIIIFLLPLHASMQCDCANVNGA